MTNIALKTREFFRERAAQKMGRMHVLDEKRKNLNFRFWAERHAMEYIGCETALEHWNQMLRTIDDKMIDKTDEEIVRWVEGLRTYFIDLIISSRPHSSNQMANIIAEEKVDVYREIVGTRMIESDSILALIYSLRKDMKKDVKEDVK
jgi:hypothetical protein